MNEKKPPLTKQEIRKCFDICQLVEWQNDPANKACVEGIEKRIDVIMTMNIRKNKREQLTEQEEWELQQFEQQYRDRNKK